MLSKLDRVMRLTQHKPDGVEYDVSTYCMRHLVSCMYLSIMWRFHPVRPFAQPNHIVKPVTYAHQEDNAERQIESARLIEAARFAEHGNQQSTAATEFLDHAAVNTCYCGPCYCP